LLAQLVKYDVHTTRKIKIDTRYFLSHIIILFVSLSFNNSLEIVNSLMLHYTGCSINK